ncbi:MCE family protein [Pseudonocardia spinosispora]|uniref:MCE family protein n=1 Tax=Pseudonocardia spinosispora TaxID=103441 RepID=UPI00040AD922|nr:MCE family protein [Pseudonocardia spinosispora]
MSALLRGVPRLAWALLGALAVVAAVVHLVGGGNGKHGTAYFAETKGVYPGDAIRVLGMQVGAIDKITPDGDRVRVDFHYDREYSLPAHVNAAILSPTLVATRFIQLDPPYTEGPTLPEGGVIPVERTASPVEFDELKAQLSQLSDALGPNGANEQGALNRALTTIDANGRGEGQNFHDMLTSLSKAAKTLSDGRGDLFGTVRNLAGFSAQLSRYDDRIVEFDHRLADVSATLDDNSDELRSLLPKIDDAATQVDDFLGRHGDQLHRTVDLAGSVSRNLAQQRMNIANVLHVGPNALTNFVNIFNPRTGTIDPSLSANNVAGFGGPGDAICAAITSAAAADVKKGQDMCVQYLGPVFRHLAMQSPPVGLSPVAVPRGSLPSYGNVEDGQPDTNYSPNGSNSDLPRSSTANGDDRTYPGPESLGELGQKGGR